jgi:hypothetical protein
MLALDFFRSFIRARVAQYRATMANNKSTGARWVRGSLCVFIAVVGTAYALILKIYGLVGTEATFFGFTCLFIFVGIVVYILPELQELNLKELKVVLRDIKEAEQRIYARVDTLKQLSMVLTDILIMHDVNIGRLSTGPEDYKLLREWLDKKRAEVLTLVEATPAESANLLRFRNLYDSFDSEIERPQNDPGKEEALDRALQKIREQFKREIS